MRGGRQLRGAGSAWRRGVDVPRGDSRHQPGSQPTVGHRRLRVASRQTIHGTNRLSDWSREHSSPGRRGKPNWRCRGLLQTHRCRSPPIHCRRGTPVTEWHDLATRHAWRGAFAAAALNAVGMPVDFLLARELPKMPIYPSVMSALVGIGLIVFLLIRRQRATVRLGSVAFLLNMVAILVALWITSGYWAT